MEVGRRKKEEAIKSIASAINNVVTVLAVAIFDFPFIPRKVRRSDSRLWYSVRTLQLTVNSQQSTVNSQQSTVNCLSCPFSHPQKFLCLLSNTK